MPHERRQDGLQSDDVLPEQSRENRAQSTPSGLGVEAISRCCDVKAAHLQREMGKYEYIAFLQLIEKYISHARKSCIDQYRTFSTNDIGIDEP